jgi:uncharacterized protein (TIGR02231 family)
MSIHAMGFLKVKTSKPVDSDNEDSDSEDTHEVTTNLKEMLAPESLKSLVDACTSVNAQQLKYDVELKKLSTKIHEIQNHISELKKLLSKIKTKESKSFSKYSIAVNLPTTELLEFEIYYMMPNCTWKPTYELQVNTLSTDKSLSLTYYAMVMQNTKEDWKDIPIVLTSVDTALGVTPLKLDTLNVHSSTQSRGFLSNLFGSLVRPDEIIDTVAESLIGTKSKGVALCTFELDVSNIPSDNCFHRIVLTKLDLGCELTHYCVPSKDPNVYLQLRATNSSKYSLLTGPMDVYLDGGYVSLSQLNDVNPSEHFECFLGTDPTVKSKYALPKRYSTSSGFFSTTVKTLVKRQISLTNTKQGEIKVLIKDQLPHSNSSQIKVNLVHPKMEKNHVDLVYNKQVVSARIGENNNVEWMATIKGGIEVAINFEYIVEMPGGTVTAINSIKSAEF